LLEGGRLFGGDGADSRLQLLVSLLRSLLLDLLPDFLGLSACAFQQAVRSSLPLSAGSRTLTKR